MKTLAAIALASIFTISPCHADITDKLIGAWSGTGTATSNGTAVAIKISTVCKRYEGTGLRVVTTSLASGQKSIGTSRFHSNGKVEGELKQNGSVVALISGTWTATNNALKYNVKAEGIFPTFRISSKVTLVTANRIKITESTSRGEYSVGSLKRK